MWTTCTSHVERCNLTIRTFMKRFTRLALGFSKKLDNLAAATALHFGVYNFCRVHGSLNGCTPAMAAGVIRSLWSFEEFYNNVMDLEESRKQAERRKKLLAKLKSL